MTLKPRMLIDGPRIMADQVSSLTNDFYLQTCIFIFILHSAHAMFYKSKF